MKELFKERHDVIVALDFLEEESLYRTVDETQHMTEIIGYKSGGISSLLLGGIKNTIFMCKERTDKPIIYDHQKLATGDCSEDNLTILHRSRRFTRLIKEAGADAAIFFHR